jgi:hypothetical protein
MSFSSSANAGEDMVAEMRDSVVKTTVVPWNPSKPPKAPTLREWLKVQDAVSPFGPINLPTDTKDRAPLGGQLKSPLRNIDTKAPKTSGMISKIPLATQRPSFPSYIGNKTTTTTIPKSPSITPKSPKQPDALPQHSIPGPSYRESKASLWTDDIPYQTPSPALHSSPKPKRLRGTPAPESVNKGYEMTVPSPKTAVRTTAEWLAARADAKVRDSQTSFSESSAYIATANVGVGIKGGKPWKPSMGLPNNPKIGSGMARLGQKSVRSSEVDMRGLNKFLATGDRASQISKSDGGDGGDRSQRTSAVGKAL